MTEPERNPSQTMLANRPIIVEEEPSSSSPDDNSNPAEENPTMAQSDQSQPVEESTVVENPASAPSNPFSRWASTIMSKVSNSVTSSPAKASPASKAVTNQQLTESLAAAEHRPDPSLTGAVPKTCSQNSTPTKKHSASPHLSSRSSSR